MNPIDFSAESYLGRTLHTAKTHLKAGGQPIRLTVDAVVVGSGPGGMVTASVLAEAGLSVVIVEAGQFWPRGSFQRKQSWATENLLQDRGTRVMTGNAFIPLASGRGVGGGTLVNSAICFRAPNNVLDEWIQNSGLSFWEEARRDKLFEEVEVAIGVAPTPASVAGENSMVAKRGFERLGIKADFMPRNAPGCAGCGTCQTGCPTGGKATADLIWLPRTLAAKGQLFADSRVEEIIMDGARAVGVRAVMRDPHTNEVVAPIEIRAERVIVAAGAVNTPMILQKQKLANSSGQVGQNLHVHPTCAVIAKFSHDIRLWHGATQGYYAHHPEDPEILLETFSASPEVFLSQAASIGVHNSADFLRSLRKIAACGLLIRDHSAGSVQRTSSGRPKLSYHLHQSDRRKITRGLLTLVDVFFAAGARSVMPFVAHADFCGANEAKTLIEKADDPSLMGLYSSHPMGTCRLGADSTTSVVRPQDGRTHDVEGLYITDSSLFPSALGANPQVTIMAQSLALARGMLRS